MTNNHDDRVEYIQRFGEPLVPIFHAEHVPFDELLNEPTEDPDIAAARDNLRADLHARFDGIIEANYPDTDHD